MVWAYSLLFFRNSELEDASNSILERQRGLGGSSLQGLKRNDYGSLPLNRLDGSGSYSRGSSGRWDTRSSGSSDRDGDLQSDRESVMQGLLVVYITVDQ